MPTIKTTVGSFLISSFYFCLLNFYFQKNSRPTRHFSDEKWEQDGNQD